MKEEHSKQEDSEKESKKKEENKSQESEKFFSFDHKKAWQWIKKNRTWLLMLIPIILSLYLRTMPLGLAITEDWASQNIHQQLRTNIQNQVNQQYPNLPQQQKEKVAGDLYQQSLDQGKDQIDQQIKANAEFFKSQLQDEQGQTYLLAIDPYLWLGTARNYITYGHSGDVEENGKKYYSLRGGRFNQVEGINPIAWVIAKIYQIMKLFNKDASLMRAAFLLPVILMALAVIPAYLIGKRIAGETAGFFSGMIIAFHPAIIHRTMGGFADNDAFNALFSLVVAWAMLKAVDAKTTKEKMVWSGITALSVTLFQIFWSGFWFIFLFILLMLICYIVYLLVLEWRRTKKVKVAVVKDYLFSFLTVYLGSAILSMIISGMVLGYGAIAEFIKMLKSPFLAITFNLKEVAIRDIWPNVLTTVAELNAVSFNSIISSLGGVLLFVLALLAIILAIQRGKEYKKEWIIYVFSIVWYFGIVYVRNKLSTLAFVVLLGIPLGLAILKNWKDQDKQESHQKNVQYGLIMLIWIAGTFYASTISIRFIALMVPVFAIALGVSIGKITSVLGVWFEESFGVKKTYTLIVAVLLFSLLLLSPLNSSLASAKQQVPSYSDGWQIALDAIKNDAEDGIITSWWDFGHWFVAMGQRRVTFDGGDQGKRIHWVGKLLLTDNEEESIGILKMLNCGNGKAYDILNKYNNREPADSVNLLYTISNKEKEDAETLLKDRGLTQEQAEEVTSLTHCELLPQYVITSQDMIQKSGVWGHFGSWDFTRAKMFNEVKGKTHTQGTNTLKEKYNLSQADANAMYNQIQSQDGDTFVAPWPGYVSGLAGCNLQGEILQCSNGAILNVTSQETFLATGQGFAKAHSLVYADPESVKEITYPDSTSGISVILIPAGTNFQSILASPQQARSMFTQLFFYDGHGLKKYKKLVDSTTVFGEKIVVWKIDWNSEDQNQIFTAVDQNQEQMNTSQASEEEPTHKNEENTNENT